MIDSLKDYKECQIRDLGFHAPSAEDEALIKDFCRLRKTDIVWLSVGGFITLALFFYFVTTISKNATSAILSLLLALGAASLTWWLAGYHPIHAVGVLHGHVGEPKLSASRRNESYEDGSFHRLIFESTKQIVTDTVIPKIIVPKIKEVKITRDMYPFPNTDVMVVKIQNNKYQIIYPGYYLNQERRTNNGTATNSHETNYARYNP